MTKTHLKTEIFPTFTAHQEIRDSIHAAFFFNIPIDLNRLLFINKFVEY